MAPRYQIGQKVIINPATISNLSLRSSELEPYVGHTGEVKDYYWITLDRGVSVDALVLSGVLMVVVVSVLGYFAPPPKRGLPAS